MSLIYTFTHVRWIQETDVIQKQRLSTGVSLHGDDRDKSQQKFGKDSCPYE